MPETFRGKYEEEMERAREVKVGKVGQGELAFFEEDGQDGVGVNEDRNCQPVKKRGFDMRTGKRKER